MGERYAMALFSFDKVMKLHSLFCAILTISLLHAG